MHTNSRNSPMQRRTLPIFLLGLSGYGYTWQEYNSSEGNDSCLLPGKPQAQTKSKMSPAGMLTFHNQAVEVKPPAFLVGYSDMPPLAAFDYDAGITNALQSWAAS